MALFQRIKELLSGIFSKKEEEPDQIDEQERLITEARQERLAKEDEIRETVSERAWQRAAERKERLGRPAPEPLESSEVPEPPADELDLTPPILPEPSPEDIGPGAPPAELAEKGPDLLPAAPDLPAAEPVVGFEPRMDPEEAQKAIREPVGSFPIPGSSEPLEAVEARDEPTVGPLPIPGRISQEPVPGPPRIPDPEEPEDFIFPEAAPPLEEPDGPPEVSRKEPGREPEVPDFMAAQEAQEEPEGGLIELPPVPRQAGAMPSEPVVQPAEPTQDDLPQVMQQVAQNTAEMTELLRELQQSQERTAEAIAEALSELARVSDQKAPSTYSGAREF